MVNKKTHSNPKISYMGTDFLLLLLSSYIVLKWFPLVAKDPFSKYFIPVLAFVSIWFLSGIAFKKYRSYYARSLKSVLIALTKANTLSIVLSFIIILFLPHLDLSAYVLLAVALGLYSFEILSVLIFYSFRYAINIEKDEIRPDIINHVQVLKADELLDELTQQQIQQLILQELGKQAMQALYQRARVPWRNTFVLSTTSVFNILSLKNNRYSTIINLRKVNDIRGINEFFISAHDKLPFQGYFIGCYRSKSSYKKDFLNRYPVGLNYLLYSLNYMIKRMLPKLSFTREIYFWLTGGKKRILTKAEVLGRLYCCGFEVVDEYKIDKFNYFVARKQKEPNRNEVTTYGPIIKLNRVGKNGKLFKVYKFRTMHPFSEYLQSYIFEKNSLQEGGKFARDIRVTSVGRFMRRFWLDELPMLWNLIKGDMKLVGVRPISKQYFSLYSKELQDKRTKHKPGLLPPFYADMPKTLDEIQDSEMRYLVSCEKNGTFFTDLSYLWRILVNILVKKARSN